MAKFEAHVTLDRSHSKAAQELAEAMGWVYSQITGCPLLGQGTYCYLTGYNPDGDALLAEMNGIAVFLRAHGIEPLRLKIERIVYDSRTGVHELTT